MYFFRSAARMSCKASCSNDLLTLSSNDAYERKNNMNASVSSTSDRASRRIVQNGTCQRKTYVYFISFIQKITAICAAGIALNLGIKIYLTDFQYWVLSTAKLFLRFLLCYLAESCFCRARSTSTRRRVSYRVFEVYKILKEIFSISYIYSVGIYLVYIVFLNILHAFECLTDYILFFISKIPYLMLFGKLYCFIKQIGQNLSQNLYGIFSMSRYRRNTRTSKTFTTPLTAKVPCNLQDPHDVCKSYGGIETFPQLSLRYITCRYCRRRWKRSLNRELIPIRTRRSRLVHATSVFQIS